LTDDRKDAYRQITAMSSAPQDVTLEAPTAGVEPTVKFENGGLVSLYTWANHLMCADSGSFPADLNEWEQKVIKKELGRAPDIFWYRNPQQAGPSSLGIAYQNGNSVQMVRPDFVFFAKEGGTYKADIVDPHGAHLGDAAAKLKGLAIYATTHGTHYRRIESVNEVKNQLRVLNLRRIDVQAAIAKAHTSAEVDALFAGVLADDYK
jgi:type III restriction enzyme